MANGTSMMITAVLVLQSRLQQLRIVADACGQCCSVDIWWDMAEIVKDVVYTDWQVTISSGDVAIKAVVAMGKEGRQRYFGLRHILNSRS